MKNHPSDSTVMGVNNDLHGGVKVVNTHAEMLAIHPNYLLKDYTACLVTNDDGLGASSLYLLTAIPSNATSTIDDDWTEWDIGTANIPSELNFKGKFDPTSYTLADAGVHAVGDLYIVENSLNPSNVNDVNLLGGVATDVYSNDFLVYTSDSVFLHINRSNDSIIIWDTLLGIPTAVTDLIAGTVQAHTQDVSTIDINLTVDGTLRTQLSELLPLLVFSHQFAVDSGSAQDDQMLTYGQIKELYSSSAQVQTDIEAYVDGLIALHYTSAEVDALLLNKQGTLDAESAKTLLEGGGYKVLTTAEYDALANAAAPEQIVAKVYLVDAIPQDGIPIDPTITTTTYGEEYITALRGDSTSVELVFKFSSFVSYDGTINVNGTTITNITRDEGDIFEGRITVDLSAISDVVITGDVEVTIPVEPATDVIDSITLPTLTLPKTHYKDEETAQIDVISTIDPSSYQIIPTTGVLGVAKTATPASVDNLDGTWTTTITFTADYTVAGTLNADIKIVLWDQSDDIQQLHTESAVFPVDGLLPSISDTGVVYPVGQTAIKASESITITPIVVNTSLVEYTFNGTLFNNTGVGNQAILQRISGTDEVDTVTITAKRESNGEEISTTVDLRILNGVVDVLDTTGLTLSEGETNVLNWVDPLDITSMALFSADEVGVTFDDPNGTVTLDMVNAITYGTNLTVVIDVTTSSLEVIQKTITFQAKGFAEKTYVLTYPTFDVPLTETVVDINDLIVSVTLNTSPTLEIGTLTKDADGPEGYTYDGQIHLSEDLTEVGYFTGVTATVRVEETA
jgi:hypothetical protein